ncbi:hypothetical protein BH11ACT3_BH11ACT3_24260 [soil metagenome]
MRIVVTRSGGFAGETRRWEVRLQDEPEWRALVDACPWGYRGRDTASRDRFVWRIAVSDGRRTRRATVPDADMTGAWRALVDRAVIETVTDTVQADG